MLAQFLELVIHAMSYQRPQLSRGAVRKVAGPAAAMHGKSQVQKWFESELAQCVNSCYAAPVGMAGLRFAANEWERPRGKRPATSTF